MYVIVLPLVRGETIMLNLTLKPMLFRFWMMTGVLLLIGTLALNCQPKQSTSLIANKPIANKLTPQTSDDNPNPGQDDSKIESQHNLPTGRKAIALIYVINPWKMVLGSDSPTLALYGDGLLIFTRRAQSGDYEYASVMLNRQERNALVSSLPIKKFRELQSDYQLTGATDQKTTIISLWDNNQLKTVSVYGEFEGTAAPKHEDAPPAFIEAYEKLGAFRKESASRWMPEKMEMMIWPFDGAGEALPWPKDWPDTKNPETKKRGDGRDQISYSIYLTPAQYETFENQASKKSANVVLIDGRKWAFSFRFPFPNEEDWRKK
jgi:hypothetical protein